MNQVLPVDLNAVIKIVIKGRCAGLKGCFKVAFTTFKYPTLLWHMIFKGF